ncbi:MAG: hypothetical protein RBS48_04945 [Ignavibacteriaceae bacterium]|jgi:hypothetical protein|nr:hypothetical protein [Ignavibacteriaceae bacterium]
MKKHTVQSSYKNPDKFISNLKVDSARQKNYIKSLTNRITELNKEKIETEIFEKNEFWFEYVAPASKLNVSFTGYPAVHRLAKLDIGSPIYCVGEITKICRSKDESSAEFRIGSVYTRRENDN